MQKYQLSLGFFPMLSYSNYISRNHVSQTPRILNPWGFDFRRGEENDRSRIYEDCPAVSRRTSGQTSPNPMVGAVVVKDGNIVGMGLIYELVKNTQKFMPFKWLVRTPKTTVYVTLEPCSHFGKTPPCCELLIEKGVKRVVIATLDCNPLVSGNGKRIRS